MLITTILNRVGHYKKPAKPDLSRKARFCFQKARAKRVASFYEFHKKPFSQGKYMIVAKAFTLIFLLLFS